MAIGQIPERREISNITNAYPCVVTTVEDVTWSTGQLVRLTDLNGMMPFPNGVDPLNNYKFEIVITGDNEFYLKDPITHKKIDSTNYPPYNQGGSANLVTQDYFYHGDEEDEENEVS